MPRLRARFAAAALLLPPSLAAARRRPARRPRFALPDRQGRAGRARQAARQGRLRRFLGVVVRPVQALVPVDERDAAEVRRARASPSSAINVDKKRERRRASSSPRIPADFTVVFDEAGTTPAAYGGEGHAELVSRRRAAATSTFVERGFLDEHKAELEQRIARAASARREELMRRFACASRCRSRCRSRWPRARRIEPPKPWEKGNLARPDMQFDYDRLDAQDAAAHLHEQGSRDRRLRRRRRRLWLQLTRRADAPASAAAPARGALALPGVVPHAARAVGARQGHLRAASTSSYRDWQPGRNRMKVDAPAFYALMPLGRYVGGRRRHGLRRDVGRVAAVLQRAVRRVDRATTAPPATSRSPSTSTARRSSVGAVRVVASRTSCRAAGRSTCSIFSDGPQPHVALGRRRHQRPHQREQRRRAQRDAQDALEFVVGITQALSPNDIVQSNLTYYTRPRLLLRSVQAARQPARRPPDAGLAHALQPVFRRARTRR